MLRNYLTIALRNLRKQKGYAFINIAGLGVGLAGCLLILLYVQDEWRYDRHHEKADEIYRVALEAHTENGTIRTAQTAPAWAPLLAQDYPEVLAAVRFKPPNQKWLVAYEDQHFFEKGFVFADSNVFDVFSFHLLRGDPETALAAPFTTVLTASMARKYFGEANPIGQTLRLDNQFDFTVTGVLEDPPRTTHFPFGFLASMSSLENAIYGEGFLRQDVGPAIYTYVLFEHDTSAEAFEEKLPAFVERHVGAKIQSIGIDMAPFLQPLTDIHLNSNLQNEVEANGDRTTVYLLLMIAFFILLIASINFMNLATARAAGRAREVGMRKVLGAYRRQLIQQFLSESILMTLVAAVLAFGLVLLVMPFFGDLTGKPLTFSRVMSPAFLLGSLVLALVVGFASGSYPAFVLSGFEPVSVLKGTLQSQGRGGALRKGLVVFQFAVSIFLLVATAVVYDQLHFVRNKRLGFDKEHVLVLQLSDPGMRAQYAPLRSRLEQLPDVVRLSASSSAPGNLVGRDLVLPEGVPEEQSTLFQVFGVDYDFTETLSLEMVAGRSFSRDFGTDPAEAFILNETAVRTLGWSSPQEAIGRGLQAGNGKKGRVIGVVHDFHSESLRQQIEPVVLTMSHEQTFFYVMVRIRPGHLPESIASIKNVWRDVFPPYVFEYSFLDEDFDRLYAAEQKIAWIFGAFALLTILIACLGLFGLASFTTQQRTKEIGIRKVLGASVPGLILLLSKEFGRLVLVAFLIAAPLAYLAMDRWLDAFSYRINIHPALLFLAGLLALAIAYGTVSYQSIKAAVANPIDSLRYE